jgi:hypothetical protein
MNLELKKMQDLPQVDCPVNELLDSVTKTYTRELLLPAGTLAVGRIHKKPCLNIITKGKFLIKTSLEDEGEYFEVPENQNFMFITNPGSQKIVFALEDTIVINVFSDVESKTLDDVEKECVEDIMKSLEGGDNGIYISGH